MKQEIVTNIDDRSLGELFSELAGETGTLVRQEISLAQAEFTHKAKTAAQQSAMLALGAAVAYAAFLAVMAGIILLLAMIIPAWAAAIVVGIAVGFAGYLTITRALDTFRSTNMAPTETVRTLKEDARWLKKQMT